jgi:hypothetical protein
LIQNGILSYCDNTTGSVVLALIAVLKRDSIKSTNKLTLKFSKVGFLTIVITADTLPK